MKAVELNQRTLDKIKESTLIYAESRSHKGSRKALYLSEQATSDLCLRWASNPPKDVKSVDDFIFISSKNAVIDVILREKAQKRVVYSDNGNLNLSEDYEGMTLEIADEGIEEKIEEEARMDQKIQVIIDTILENKWVEEVDKDIFIEKYINGKTITAIAEQIGLSTKRVSRRLSKIKNILNYMQQKDNEEDGIYKEQEEILSKVLILSKSSQSLT